MTRCKKSLVLLAFSTLLALDLACAAALHAQKLRIAYTAFAGTFGAVVDANLAGAHLIMVGCQYDKGQTSFFTTPPIASIGGVKGKAVGVSRFGAFSDFVARHSLLQEIQKEMAPSK
ncbi:MAG TPA: hypothetical protein VGK77_20925 [Candidatus Binatia bacterium]|jgi:hypothetical protein